MKTIQVKFENSQYNYLTDVSDNATKESIENYFIGTFFNVAPYPTENMQKCIGAGLVEFYFFCGSQKIYVAENRNFFTLQGLQDEKDKGKVTIHYLDALRTVYRLNGEMYIKGIN